VTITATYGSSSASATLTVTPGSVSFTHYDFSYANRASLIAAGWDFLAVTNAGTTRNTEQTSGAVVDYNQTAHPGVLRIPADVGDLWGSSNNTRNSVFRNLAPNWSSVRMKLSFAPTLSYQQAGLVAYQNDDTYVQITHDFNSGSSLASFVREQYGSPAVLSTAGVTQSSLYLRLDRDATDNISGYYSLDGTSWTLVGSTNLALTNPRVAIVVAASPSGFPNADISWLEVTTTAAGVGLSSLTMNPSSVTGGSSSQGTVTLNGAAPSGGAVVTLNSSNTAVASPPSSVTVPASSTTATFTVTTASVTTATPVTITGTYSGSGASGTLTVNPAVVVSVSSVSLNPSSVTGGASSQGTVTMSAAAPTGGAVVTLSSSNTTVASTQASVTVAAGSTSATFTITTTAVTTATPVTITGSYSGSSASATLTVNPSVAVAVSSVALNPSSVTGGSSSQGTVTLNAAAPTGGAVVTLSSSNTAVASTQSSVTVAAGSTTATFTVTTASVTTATPVTITGTYSGSSASATLTVNPPVAVVVSSVTLNPSGVTGGSNSQGTVTLNVAAPSGGIVVTLTSSNTAVAGVPSNVTVTAGLTSATFPVTTTAVTTATNVTITATYGSSSKNATLTVNPGSSSFAHYDFNYANRASLLAGGWDFLAKTAAGTTRNTEQTTGAVVDYNQAAHPGVLRIPADVGDLWGGANDTRNSVFRNLAPTWSSVRMKLTFAPTLSYQQANLVAYQDDDNYVEMVRIFNGANNVAFAMEQYGSPAVLASAGVTQTTLYLRLDRDATDKITGYYSADGTNWTSVGSITQTLTNPRLGIIVAASPSGFPNADISWVEVTIQ
jgi:regulation of enolase protein 1 (concanavalin A-like superfamily)